MIKDSSVSVINYKNIILYNGAVHDSYRICRYIRFYRDVIKNMKIAILRCSGL